MRLVGEAFSAIAATFAKIDGDGQSSCAGGNVDGSPTSKVETTELERPAVGVPSPAGDGVVDDGFPYEHEDEDWTKFATFSNGTDCDDDTREIN